MCTVHKITPLLHIPTCTSALFPPLLIVKCVNEGWHRPLLVVWRYPSMLATPDPAGEGRDDGAKMAARLRVLPLWGQDALKETRIPDRTILGNWWSRFHFSAQEMVMAWEYLLSGDEHRLDAAAAGSEDRSCTSRLATVCACNNRGTVDANCGVSAVRNGQILWHVVDLMTGGSHLMARCDLAPVSVVWFMHCSHKRWCVLLRRRPPVEGFCPPHRRRWGWVSGSFLEQEPISPPLVREWVLARHPELSRTVGLGTSFYSQGEL